jgi:hypothetical protein
MRKTLLATAAAVAGMMLASTAYAWNSPILNEPPGYIPPVCTSPPAATGPDCNLIGTVIMHASLGADYTPCASVTIQPLGMTIEPYDPRYTFYLVYYTDTVQGPMFNNLAFLSAEHAVTEALVTGAHIQSVIGPTDHSCDSVNPYRNTIGWRTLKRLEVD